MKWGRVLIIVVCSVVITALGIDASDTLRGSQSTLLSQVISRNVGACPAGMKEVNTIPGITCIDIYEATVGGGCPNQHPEQMLGTLQNIETPGCLSESKEGELPWSFITRDQAMAMCARSEKRLPTSEEWYALTLGMTTLESCNMDSKKVSPSGAYGSCVSPLGAHDTIGNVWEWVSDDVIHGEYNSFELPESGYVAQVDGGGVATVTGTEPNELFGKDYFWAPSEEGAYAMIRGGYYDSGDDAGLYTVHANTLPTAASAGVGFRCVK